MPSVIPVAFYSEFDDPVAESIRRVLRGEAPLHQVDPARGY